jgi:hypothetical protein
MGKSRLNAAFDQFRGGWFPLLEKEVPGMAGGTFRLADIKHVVDAVSGNATFPLADAAALETALGGASATVALGAERHQASEVRQIPADFFPIGSAADLFTKLAALRSANGDKPEDLGSRNPNAPRPAGSPPPDAGPPPPVSGRNVPSVQTGP